MIYAPAGINFWDILVPILYVGFAIFIFFMLFRMMAGANKSAMAFGKTKVKTYTISKVKFSDIAGMDEEKAELQEIVEFLKNLVRQIITRFIERHIKKLISKYSNKAAAINRNIQKLLFF